MRGLIPGLASPAPLTTRLPGILQDDEFLQRFVLAFDDSIAPVYSVLDNLHAYIDPRVAPADFLDWISTWVHIEVAADWPVEQRREIIAGAVALHRMRGTVEGIREAVRLAAGPHSTVDVVDSGGVSASSDAGTPLPGSPDASVRVTVRTSAPLDDAAQRRLHGVVAATVPAHVPFTLVVEPGEGPGA